MSGKITFMKGQLINEERKFFWGESGGGGGGVACGRDYFFSNAVKSLKIPNYENTDIRCQKEFPIKHGKHFFK